MAPSEPKVPEVFGPAEMEVESDEMDGKRAVSISMRGKVALCGSAYFSLILAFLFVSSTAGIDYLQTQAALAELGAANLSGITGSLEEAQASWGQMPFHLAIMDASAYPEGDPDPSKPIPRDTAHIPTQFYEEILPEVEEVEGILAREVLASFCKIVPEGGNLSLPMDQYMGLIGIDAGYLEIFLNITPSLSMAPCPACNGSGCQECNWTGEWGTYPREGGITLPEGMMETGRLELYYDQDTRAWTGSKVRVYYDLEGKLSPGSEGYLEEYISNHGPATSPPNGLELEVVGVTQKINQGDPKIPVGLVSIQDAWILKGVESDPAVSFIYIRVPNITDFGEVNNQVTGHLYDYDLYVQYPALRSRPGMGFKAVPLVLSTASITIVVMVISLLLGSKIRR